MTNNVRQVLRGALEAKKWSVERLLAESRLTCDRSSLHRKLFGTKQKGKGSRRIYQRINIEELAKLSRALDVTVSIEASSDGGAA